ncbi:MAG: hypothetical protein HYS27_13320 [Deltaproteobacteria bacterium]|nr:hypothetical protein [Deltaproteobacteria bacterium]
MPVITPRQPNHTTVETELVGTPREVTPNGGSGGTGTATTTTTSERTSRFEGTSSTSNVRPAGGGGHVGAAGLVGRSAPTFTPTPKFTLADAVADASFASKDPATLPVPQAILDAVAKADTVLLIGHVGPDGDCVGTTLTMQRALEKLGKRCEVCIDDDLAGSLRNLDVDKRVRRARDLGGKRWDLALVMDVGVPDRIGGALGLLQQAGEVAVVDHHVVTPKREHFALRDGVPFHAWVEQDWPCAALQAMAIVGKQRAGMEAAHADWASVLLPSLAGFCTDTGFGRYEGLDKEKFRFFKHSLKDLAKLEVDDVKRALDYRLPVRVTDAINGTSTAGAPAVPQPMKATLEQLAASHHGVCSTVLQKGPQGGGLGVLTVSDAFVQSVLELGRLDDKALVEMDVTNVLKFGRVGDMKKQGAEITAFLIEKGGAVFASLRGPGDTALALATHLGGGGHGQAAGARIPGATLEEVQRKIEAWARANGLAA